MDAGKYGLFCPQTPSAVQHNTWENTRDDDDNIFDSESTMSSSFDDSSSSSSSSSSLDLAEDASSSTSNSSVELNKGPLYELSELMSQLPIKRGLSAHFQGKSQSFTSLSNVRCIEDLVKRENPYRKKMKCKSFGGVDGDANKSYAPRTCSKIIAKKVSRGSFLSSLGKRGSLNNSPKSPFHLQKNFCK